jgi:hypothetical protein
MLAVCLVSLHCVSCLEKHFCLQLLHGSVVVEWKHCEQLDLSRRDVLFSFQLVEVSRCGQEVSAVFWQVTVPSRYSCNR